MKIAVTGGMGFIGHEVVSRFLKMGHEVAAVDYWEKLIPSYEENRLPIMEDLYKDLPRCYATVDPWSFVQDFKEYAPDIVVHAGAVVDTKDLGSEDLFQKNVTYTQDLTTAASQHGSHIIFFSSAAVYGSNGYPNNPYGLTKAMGEKIVRRSKTRTASLRLFNVFGRNEHHKGTMASMPWKMQNSFRKNARIDIHSLNSKRDFIPSSGVVEAVVDVADIMMAPKTAADSGQNWHKEFDVGTGIPTSFSELIAHFSQLMHRHDLPVNVVDIPNELRGRYQDFTCAGKNGVENIGGKIGTQQGLQEAYGADNR